MASEIGGEEPIQTFLERLKLAEKYLDVFLSNGYNTVNDCYGITEEQLKEIGVTLPGHYRRILSKLPGCSIKKPPRQKLTSSNENEVQNKVIKDDVIRHFSSDADVFEPEDVYELPLSDQIHHGNEDEATQELKAKSGSISSGDSLTNTSSFLASHNAPKKPPRSPECLRRTTSIPVRSISNDDSSKDPSSYYEEAHKPSPENKSFNSVLEESPFPSSEQVPADEESATYSLLQIDSPQIVNQDKSVDDVYDSLNSDVRPKNLPLLTTPPTSSFPPLPSPPLLHFSSTEKETFAVPSSNLNEKEINDENSFTHNDVDEKLSISRSESTKSSLASDSTSLYESYGKLENSLQWKHSPLQLQDDLSAPTANRNLQTPPVRMPAYEEIALNVEPSNNTRKLVLNNDVKPKSADSNPPVFEIDSLAKSTLEAIETVLLPTPTSEPDSIFPIETVTDTSTSPKISIENTDSSASFDTYETACDVDKNKKEENIYEECNEQESSTPKTSKIMKNLDKLSKLPRASGSLPSCAINPRLSQLPTAQRRQGPRHSIDELRSNHSFDRDDNVDTDIAPERGVEENDVYQSIDSTTPDPNTANTKRNSVDVKARKGLIRGSSRFNKLLPNKKARPFSAFVENFRHDQFGAQSHSDEHLDSWLKEPHKQHARALSTSSDIKNTSGANNAESDNKIRPTPQSPRKMTKRGWLQKHGGYEGRAPVRKRYVVFDGEELIYYESDTKTELSKGIVPIGTIMRVQADPIDNRTFNIQTKGGRKYIFNAESADEKTLWTSTLLAAMMIKEKQPQEQFKPGGSMCMPYKEGLIKMEGSRQKVYLATKEEKLAYYKSKDEFNFGQPVARLSMEIATVKELDKKRFQIIFPFKSFSFTADSEEEKRSWVESLNDAIAEGLSDYKVVNEVWESKANRKCADCGRDDPDWASINLAIVICKHCAGVHRELGVHNSKVRSLKMDVKIWDETMKNLLFMLGNDVANSFWGARLRSSDAINDMADKKQRAWHITSKYIELQYLKPHRCSGDQQALNKALIEAVRNNDIREAYTSLFSGADPNCGTGKDHAKTPFLLSKHLGYHVIAEFLSQNGATSVASPQGHVTDRSNCVQKKDSLPKTRVKPPVLLKDCLYKYGGDFKNSSEEKKQGSKAIDFIMRKQGEFQRRMCVLENNCFKYFDPEKPNVAKDEVECSELISIAICQPELATKAGYSHCFEVGRNTGRTYLFCTDHKDTSIKWTRGLMQAIVPPHVQNAMKHVTEFDRIGKMWIKSQHRTRKASDWKPTWCRLIRKTLYYFHQESITMESIDLRKLVQISLDQSESTNSVPVTSQVNKEVIPTFLLVFREKSYYFRSETKSDSEAWMAAVRKADGESGPDIFNQQLTADGVPVVLEKCMTFVEQFGLSTRGIYRLNGTHSKTTQLLNDFKQNARETQMHESDLNMHDVASALKRWLKSLPGSLLTEELHEQWVETSQIKEEHHTRKLEWYKHLVDKLPEINRNTLKMLLIHLNNVANHSAENDMTIHNLAIVFGPTLLQPQADGDSKYVGETSQEIGCVEDLITYYAWLYDVTDVDREKERIILEAKEKISMARQQQHMLTTLDYDMMVPIYIDNKDGKCVNYKVNMNAGELIARICSTHGYPAKTWGLFEVIADGDAERPLHFTDHVLSVIKSWEMPSTNYLLAKHDYVREKLRWMKTPSEGGAMELLYEGQLKVYDNKKKWIRMSASLKMVDGGLSLIFAKTKGATNISLNHYNAYLGFDKRTKPPLPHCFMLSYRGEIPRYFAVDSETNLYKWFGHILISKHPEGFTPLHSPVLSPDEASPPRKNSDSEKPRFAFPSVTQGDLSEAARLAALQRMGSFSGDEGGGGQENLYEDPINSNDRQHSPGNRTSPPGYPGNLNLLPLETGANLRRPPSSTFLTSPVSQQRGSGFLGIKLQSELSSVLKKRTGSDNPEIS